MFKKLIYWDIYEIFTQSTKIKGVMLRGRIRKFCLEEKRNVLIENAEEGAVRFAIPATEDCSAIKEYLKKILPDGTIDLVKENIPNPTLSKLKVNSEERYEL